MWEGGEILTRPLLEVPGVCVCFQDGLENVETRHKRRFSSFIWSMKKAAGFVCSRELTGE